MKNKENGITLIALIITIIVMLILVGVTINIALNGGLFDKAKTASDGTQREGDREALLSAVIGTLDNNGKVIFDGDEGLDNNLPAEFEKVSNGIYKNKKTGKEYKVDSQTGNVQEYTGTSQTEYSFTIQELIEALEEYDGCLKISKTDFANLIGAASVDDILIDYGSENDENLGVYDFYYNSSYEEKFPNFASIYEKFMGGQAELLEGKYMLDIRYGVDGDTNNIIISASMFDEHGGPDEVDLETLKTEAVDDQGNSIEITLVTIASLMGGE